MSGAKLAKQMSPILLGVENALGSGGSSVVACDAIMCFICILYGRE